MAKVTMGNPLPSKGEVVGSGKDLTGTFKSLKRSLKDTLERLETIGLTDLNSGDEVSDLKIQLAQKEKTIEELTGEIKRLSILLSSRSIEPHLPASPEPYNTLSTERMLQSAGHLLQNMKTFPEFTAELSQRVSSDSEYLDLIKNREFDKALLLNLQIFNDFVTYAKRPKISVLSEKPESQMSRFSEIDQEIHDQRRLFSEICKDIGNSLSPESLESDYDDA